MMSVEDKNVKIFVNDVKICDVKIMQYSNSLEAIEQIYNWLLL